MLRRWRVRGSTSIDGTRRRWTRRFAAGGGRLVPGDVRRAHAPAAARLAGDRRGAAHPDLRPHRVGQDARGVPGLPGPPLRVPRRARGPDPLHLAPEGPQPGRLPQPPAPPRRDPGDGRGRRRAAAEPGRRGPVGRHPDFRTPEARPPAARHPDHDARIAPPDADEPGAGDPRVALARHRRRDPRPLPQQARGLPGAPAGTPGGDQSRGFRPGRPLGDAAAPGRGGPLPRGPRARRRAPTGRPGSSRAR